MAVIMVPVMSPEATGVSAPSVSSAPPMASAAPAAVAWRLPGLSPSVSKKPPVPSSPCPPNHPNSFCVPCPTNSGPMTKRSAVLPKSMAAFPVDCAVKDRVSRRWTLGNRLRVLHRVDRRHREVLADLDLDLGAVGLADVRLVRGARVHVGLDALDGAGHLLERCGLDLGGGVAAQRLLRLAVDAVPAGRRTGGRPALRRGARARARALCGAGDGGAAKRERAERGEGGEGPACGAEHGVLLGRSIGVRSPSGRRLSRPWQETETRLRSGGRARLLLLLLLDVVHALLEVLHVLLDLVDGVLRRGVALLAGGGLELADARGEVLLL